MTRPWKNPGASGIRTRDLPLSRQTPYHQANEAVRVGWGEGLPYLSLVKSFPMPACTGASRSRTANPAKTVGPSRYHRMINTAIACSGPIQRKWRNITPCYTPIKINLLSRQASENLIRVFKRCSVRLVFLLLLLHRFWFFWDLS